MGGALYGKSSVQTLVDAGVAAGNDLNDEDLHGGTVGGTNGVLWTAYQMREQGSDVWSGWVVLALWVDTNEETRSVLYISHGERDDVVSYAASIASARLRSLPELPVTDSELGRGDTSDIEASRTCTPDECDGVWINPRLTDKLTVNLLLVSQIADGVDPIEAKLTVNRVTRDGWL